MLLALEPLSTSDTYSYHFHLLFPPVESISYESCISNRTRDAACSPSPPCRSDRSSAAGRGGACIRMDINM